MRTHLIFRLPTLVFALMPWVFSASTAQRLVPPSLPKNSETLLVNEGSDAHSAVRQSYGPPTSDKAAATTVTMEVGGFTLHIPVAYVEGRDGFQGKFGYLKMKAALPCLTPIKPGEDPRMEGKGWGNVLVAQLSSLGPRERIGEELLRAHMRNNDTPGVSNFVNKDHSNDERLVLDTGFKFYEDRLLSLDFFTKYVDDKLFVLQCTRPSVFPSPSCSSRSSISDGKLLLEYYYSRFFVDNSIEQSTLIDLRVNQLFRSFLSAKSDDDVSTQGVCK